MKLALQALRFAAIYFLPPYDLVAVAIQIEGVSRARNAYLVFTLFEC